MNQVKALREQLNFTQTELAEKAGLSLRTVQRVESGIIPKGHTLSSLANALGVNRSEIEADLTVENDTDHDEDFKIKLVNLSALSFLVLPYGNIILPFFIWRKNRKTKGVNEVGKIIINFQILWSLVTSLLLLISPFVQQNFSLQFPLIIWVLIVCILINILFIIQTSTSLNKDKPLGIQSPIKFL